MLIAFGDFDPFLSLKDALLILFSFDIDLLKSLCEDLDTVSILCPSWTILLFELFLASVLESPDLSFIRVLSPFPSKSSIKLSLLRTVLSTSALLPLVIELSNPNIRESFIMSFRLLVVTKLIYTSSSLLLTFELQSLSRLWFCKW